MTIFPFLASSRMRFRMTSDVVTSQPRERLVEKQNVRIVKQGCGKKDLLAHPFRIRGDGRIHVPCESEQAQEFADSELEDAVGDAAQAPDEEQVFEGAEVRIDLGLFGNVADTFF